ncbi:MAG: acyloxyacyl hydrolase [Candidatus Aminicenantes bacterium]|nr:acyloxyacyl hydrolase [Candidatus Aminicenantes bacterium]MDH5715920.1 acyloxyacyl hydrolase [Candidatus Aminicenantes bacterium]
MRKTLLALCLTVFVACPLLGDQPDGEYRLYLAFTTGGIFFSQPDSGDDYHILGFPHTTLYPPVTQYMRFDSSYAVGFRLGYNIAPQWDLETSFQYSPTHQRLKYPIFAPSGQQNFVYREWVDKLDVFNYNTNLTYYFVKKKVQPFLTAGMGGVTFRMTGATFNNVATSTTTNFAINLGGGVKFHPKKRLRVSFDIKDLVIFNQYFFLETRNNLTLNLAAEFLF